MAGSQLSLVWCMAVTVVRALLRTGKLPDAAAGLPDQKHRPSNPPLIHRHRMGRGAGLCNLNNTCYLNALLQCLAYCPQFVTRCLGLPHSSNCPGKAIKQRETDTSKGGFWSFLWPHTPECPEPCTMCVMERLMVALLEARDGQMIAPREIAKILFEIFPDGQQHDPSEALTFIQDKMEQDSEKAAIGAVAAATAALWRAATVADLREPVAAADMKDVVGAAATHPEAAAGAAVKKVAVVATDLKTASVAAAVVKKPAVPCNIVQDVFGFSCRNQVTCRECQYVGGQASELYTQLSLGVDKVDSVAGALAMFTTKEAMTGNNQYQCPRCGTYRDADLQMRITEGPNVLVVHLKRFGKTEKANKEGSKGQPEEEAEDERGDEQVAQKEDAVVTKIDKHVAFELALDLSPYMTTTARGDRENGGVSTKGTDGSRGSNTYTLYSVLTHRGDTLQSGHYVSFVRDGEGEWWLKNDETTVPVALDDVLRQQAYMLFYCRDAVSPTTPLQEPVPVADGAAASLRQRVAASRLERVEQPEVGTSAHHQTRNRLRLSRDGHSPSSSSGGGHSDRNSGGFGVAEVGKKGREGGGNGYPTGSGEPAVSPASPAGPCSWGSSACLQSREGSGGGSCVCGCTSPTSCGMGHGICTAGSCSPGAGGSSSLLFTLGFRDGAASAVPPPCGSASTRGGPGAREERKRKRQSAGDGCTDSGD